MSAVRIAPSRQVLTSLMRDASWQSRAYAVIGLAERQDSVAVAINAAELDPSPRVRAWARYALGGSNVPLAAPFFGDVGTAQQHLPVFGPLLGFLVNLRQHQQGSIVIRFGRNQLHREVSHDGIELRFAVNYLAPFVLTYALIEQARAVVQVASVGQRALDFADLGFERTYDGIVAYRRSKLAQVMLTFDTAARFAVPTNALHPGTFLDTGMVRESGITPLGPPEQGAGAILYVIEQTLAGTTGEFFDGRKLGHADPQAYDAAARRALFVRSCELVERFIALPPAARALRDQ